ncbi:inovirus Gp2 family protein [Vibrio parahaemolyticus]|uniref:inovirus Gp2 family protein n=1 Tax=Vibrio parahaemolyticus TaxID=670 RepID=UPI0009F036C0|nr:inovirus Gp2 family protein [Vibrio parahaemolyticus]EJG0618021.1 inovirus Gp2 family protein [Vibrio parahaemolyticus]EJG0636243.1 inovirus Gp2 family protein [Vibrio parahaemolyticus]EJG0685585.1 inovirus Gp2 family protein [Vibrio parahaemolyticus]EJG0698984.1 inovirus Gp2 family protein [Vibrio parahaemolyticus]EJG0726293.1 inovirus Gp2 family protein [Vibrio parahaemolyticus]
MSNHLIHQGSLFNGLPVNTNYSLITRYLEQTHKVLNNALSEHPRTFIFPVLLRLPTDTGNDLNLERVITRFIEGFKRRLQRSIGRRKKTAQRVHATSVRYTWCREQDSSIHQHYHVFFLLNGQTYHQMGDYSYENKHHLRYMVADAWAKTLGMSIDDNKGLVEFPGKPFMLNVLDITSIRRYCKYVGSAANVYESVFYWMSYLAKVDTKQSGNGFRSFGSSVN